MKTKYFGIFLAASVASFLVCLGDASSVVSQSPQPIQVAQPVSASLPLVQLQTNPPLHQIIPATEPVQLTVKATDAKQHPLRDAVFQMRVLTPAKTPWFTSDFPIVEGTTLLEMSAIAPLGTVQFEQALPIRGTYRLEVRVIPQAAGAFEPFEQVLTFSVPENPVKYRNVAILAAILVLTGAGSGWVLAGDQSMQDDEIAPKPVRMLISAAIVLAIATLLVVNIASEMTGSHTEHSHDNALLSSAPATQTSQGIQVKLSGETQATVGQTAIQTVQITDATTQKPVTDVVVKLQVIALEHGERVFKLEGLPDQTGQFTWQPQFFDGAPHQVIATIAPTTDRSRPFLPIQVSHDVDVEGIAPPLYIRFISLIYFTLIFVVGLIVGFVLRRRFRSEPLRLPTGLLQR